MTQEERYLFDLTGFLIIRQVLTPDELSALNTIIDERDFWSLTAGREPGPHFNELKMHTGPMVEWGEPFRKLVQHPTILGYLKDLIGEKMRLDHEYAIFMKRGGGENRMHGGGTPYDPAQYYHFRNERMYNGLTVVTFALADAKQGDGGFCCIPGSHKSNIPLPSEFRSTENRGYWLIQPELQAGDALIFTEALTHGTMSWTADHERRALLYKFSPGHQSWSRRYQTADAEMDATLRRLMEPPYVYQREIVAPE